MKVFIVDDEQEILKGLEYMIRHIEWDDPLDIVGTALNGKDALDYISTNQVDLLITDIRMPGMDGMELMDEIRIRFPHIQVIILSGYDMFSYAQKAIRKGAIDYLLKPVNKEELIESFHTVRSQLQTQNKMNNIFMTNEGFYATEDVERGVVVCSLGKLSQKEITRLGGERQVSWIFHKSLIEFAESTEYMYILPLAKHATSHDRYVLGFIGKNRHEMMERMEQSVNQLYTLLHQSFKLPVSFGISNVQQGGTIHHSPYTTACRALFSRIFHGAGIYYDDEDHSDELYFNQHYIDTAMKIMDMNVINEEVDHMVQKAMENNSAASFLYSIEQLWLVIYSHLKKLNVPKEMNQVLEEIYWCKDLEQVRITLLNAIHKEIGKENPGQQEGIIIKMAKDYIRSHIHQPLNLNEISQAIYVTPQYLSRLFREKTGETFIEYLTKVRIEEAKHYLTQPGMKIYEVAEQVGYNNWKHFSRVFKQLTGYNPSEYKNKISS